ncbi:MAG TPA: autotransporter-associated beta strand repeat-containing protein [Tepidisphaeraceae bacterium]|jgi:autotransporter-associated beta strand protein|nr:autotransporter-associated beta strand repeat-containing protein [Tepidisphaeraceae bacterium]
MDSVIGVNRRSGRLVLAATLAAAGIWAAPRGASAGTYNWQDFAGDNWSNNGAWDVGAPLGTDPTTALVFGQGATAMSYTATDDLPAGGGGTFTLNSITLNTVAPDNSIGNITIAAISPANVLTFAGTSSAITMNGGGGATVSSPIAFNTNTLITNNDSTGSTLTLSGIQTYGAGTTVTFTGPGNIYSVGGSANAAQTFQNNSSIQYTGSGTLTLGPTAAGSAFTFGMNNTVNIVNGVSGGASGGTLVMNDTATGANYSGTNVTVNLANYSTGSFSIGNMSGVSGTVNINAGTVQFAGSTAGDLFGNSMILNVAAGATFDFAGNAETMGGITGAGHVLLTGANVTFTEPGDRTFTGVFSGSNGVAQDVANVLTLGGANTYSGNTTIEAGGTIRAAAANVLSPNSVVSIAALAGTLDLGGFNQTIAGLTGGARGDVINLAGGTTLTISGAIANETFAGGFSGPGNLSVTTSAVQSVLGNNTYTGTTAVNGGTLRINAGNLPASAGVSIGLGATLDAIFPANVSFTAPITGTGSLITEGAGTVTFSTDNPGLSLSGLTVLSGGVVLDDTTSSGNQIGPAPALTVGSGSLQLKASASTASVQSFSGLTVQGGAIITAASGTSATATINLGNITRGQSGTVNFALSNAASAFITTTTPNNANGIIGDFATVNGTDWASATGAGPTFNIGALPAGSYTADTWAAGNHTTVTKSSTQTNMTTYDLRFNAAAATTVTLGGTSTLNGGGVLVTPTVGPNLSSINSGTLAISAGQDLMLNQYNPLGGLTVGSVVSNTVGTPVVVGNVLVGGSNKYNQTVTVSSTAGLSLGMAVTGASTIQAAWNGHIVAINPATNQVTIAYIAPATFSSATDTLTFTPTTNVTKSGPGTVTMSGVNTFEGLFTINQGTVITGTTTGIGASKYVAATAPYGSSTLYLNGGTLDSTASSFSAGDGQQQWIIGPAGGTIEVDSFSNSVTRTGNGLYGSGTLTKTGLGILAVGSDSSPFSGQININNGTLRVTSSQLASAGNVTIAAGAQYQINDNGAATFTFGGGSILFMNGNGPNFGTNATPGAFAETVQSPGPAPTSTLPNLINLTGDTRFGDYSATFTGTLYTGATVLSGPVTGIGALIKDGPGMLTLSNANNSYGSNTTLAGTIISQGTLALGTDNAIPATSVLQFGEVNPLSTTSSNNSGTLDLKGFNQTVAGLTTAGTGPSQQIVNSATAGSTLTVNYTNTAAADTFAGQIGGGTAAAPVSNNIALTKTGPGTLVLSGSNTYSGATTITGGTLLINNVAGSGTGIGNIVINANATLGGSGSIGALGAAGGAVTVSGGGLIAAGPGGSTTGMLSLLSNAGVTASGGSGYLWKMSNAAGAAGTSSGWDEIATQGLSFTSLSSSTPFTVHVAGTPSGLSVGTSSFVIATDPAGPISINSTTYPSGSFLTGPSSVVSNLFAFDTSNFNPGGLTSSFQLELVSDGSGQDLVAVDTVVPEPGTLMLLGMGGGLLLMRRRRRA